MNERIDDAIDRAKRTGDRVYFMSIDLDHFKSINDDFGHAAGDDFLVEMATRIRASVRPYDAVIRLGDDEFLLITSCGVSSERIETLAERIRRAAREPYCMGAAKRTGRNGFFFDADDDAPRP